MKYVITTFVLLIVVVLSWAGFRGGRSEKPPVIIFPDMDFQWKFRPQDQSKFFTDGRSDRPVVPGTVPFLTDVQEEYPHLAARGGFFEDSYLATGRMGDVWGAGFPIEIRRDDLVKGQELYQINCAICHGASGDGNGVTKAFGMVAVADLLAERVVTMPEGQIFNIITHGYNTMGPYGHKIREEDRWKVIAYLRTLQLAARAPAQAVPAERRAELGL